MDVLLDEGPPNPVHNVRRSVRAGRRLRDVRLATVALGESGCGKSVSALSVMRAKHRSVGGQIRSGTRSRLSEEEVRILGARSV
jgi:ABC-type dipeptide/oligopeptide/nickel transport system ATPase component